MYNYSDEAILRLFEGVMRQAYLDKKMCSDRDTRIDAIIYINNMKKWYSNNINYCDNYNIKRKIKNVTK